jgi:metal-dependent amidase/aminoacylase/carboxypeptidase family protein
VITTGKDLGQLVRSAILPDLINQIREIPIPKEPKTQLVFGGLKCGSSYNTSPRQGSLRFEITSEGDELIGQMENQLNEICEQFSAETGTLVRWKWLPKDMNCGIPSPTHWLKPPDPLCSKLGQLPKSTQALAT